MHVHGGLPPAPLANAQSAKWEYMQLVTDRTDIQQVKKGDN